MLPLEADPVSPPETVQILVVEDEALTRFVMAEALRDLGATAIEAATADEAWQYLTTGTQVDVVFTDHRMPGKMTGVELAVRVRAEFPAIKVVGTSAFFNPVDWPVTVIAKPYRLLEIAKMLADLARSNRATGRTP